MRETNPFGVAGWLASHLSSIAVVALDTGALLLVLLVLSCSLQPWLQQSAATGLHCLYNASTARGCTAIRDDGLAHLTALEPLYASSGSSAMHAIVANAIAAEPILYAGYPLQPA